MSSNLSTNVSTHNGYTGPGTQRDSSPGPKMHAIETDRIALFYINHDYTAVNHSYLQIAGCILVYAWMSY
jgi:hypothetical protein